MLDVNELRKLKPSDPNNKMVRVSQFMLAAVISLYAKFDDDGDLITDADDYDDVFIEAQPLNEYIVQLSRIAESNNNFAELKKKYADELGSDGGSLTQDLAKKMYSEIVPAMTPATFAGLFDTYYGYSGYMCETVERWVS